MNKNPFLWNPIKILVFGLNIFCFIASNIQLDIISIVDPLYLIKKKREVYTSLFPDTGGINIGPIFIPHL
jgi:hypothetical protein